MTTRIDLGEFSADVVKKDIRNIHLSVHPPNGKVRISAPMRMDLGTIRVFAITKLAWIKQQQKKLRSQERETPRDYIDRESHYLWGRRYLIEIIEKNASPLVELKHKRMRLQIRPGASELAKQTVLHDWYRAQVKQAAAPLIAKWERLMHVKVSGILVRRMKTKWGSCSPDLATIRLNLELARKPPDCLEYVLVHEMAHLLERTHNRRFVACMDKFMPKWRFHRDELNRLPVSHQDWTY